MKFKKVPLLFVAGLGVAAIAGCTQAPKYYNILFLDEDNTVLQESEVKKGELPTYLGDEPTKASTAEFTYEFAGWDKEIVPAVEDTSYVATYSSEKNTYEIKFVNHDGTVLQVGNVEYGATPTYTGSVPTKEGNAQYSYTFNGWTPAVTAVTGPATYTAVFEEEVNKYEIKFVNHDGTLLQSTSVEYGTTPSYTGSTPTKTSTVDKVFTHNGWTPSITSVTGPATYTATFREDVREYTVTFVSDGQTVATQEVPYNQKVTAPADPKKEATAEHVFFFLGWTLNSEAFDFNTPITTDITLVASWEEVSAVEHGSRCEFTHYAAKEPTYESHGYVEFWSCDLHDNYTLVAPTVGKTVEATSPLAEQLDPSDERYIAPKEGGDKYAKIDAAKCDSEDSVLHTTEMYTGIYSVSFKLRLTGSGKMPGKGGWIAVSIGETLNKYENMFIISDHNNVQWDGEWRSYTATYNGEYGYVKIATATGEFQDDCVVEVDDITINCDAGLISEDFNDNDSLFAVNPDWVKIAAKDPNNAFYRINLGANIGEYPFIRSAFQFTGVTQVTLKARVSTGSHTGWWGFKVDPVGKDIYPAGGSEWNTITGMIGNNEWIEYTFTPSGDGYVYLVSVVDGRVSTDCVIDLDDIRVTHSGGSVTETFTGQTIFVNPSKDVNSVAQVSHIETEEASSTPEVPSDPVDGFIRLISGQVDENSPIFSRASYTNVTKVTFDLRVTGTKLINPESGQPKGAWLGFVIAGKACSIYDGTDGVNRHTIQNYALDGEWHTYDLTSFTGVNGYINFVCAITELAEGTTVDIDNIVVTSNGETYTESFVNRGSLFTNSQGTFMEENEGGSEPEPTVGTPLTLENGLIKAVEYITATSGEFHGKTAMKFTNGERADNYIHLDLPTILDSKANTLHLEIFFPTGSPGWDGGTAQLAALAVKGNSSGGSIRQYFDTNVEATYVVTLDTWCAFDIDISAYTDLTRFAIQMPYTTGAEIYLANVYVA